MAYNGKYAKPSAFVGAVLMRAAMVLLCLVVLSVYLMGGLVAKYHAVGSGEDQARVAKFDVDVVYADNESTVVDKITADLAYGENGEYSITVVNHSEVAVSYTIRIENITLVTTKDGSIVAAASKTKGVSVKLDDSEPQTLDEGIQAVSFGIFENLAPGATGKTHTLTFPIEWETYTKSVEGDNISVTINFRVIVDVTQVD